jgi:hypothetical protein
LKEEAMQMEVRRTIVYKGDEEWLAKTLAKSIQLGKPLQCGSGNTIKIDGEHRFPLEGETVVTGAEVPHGS